MLRKDAALFINIGYLIFSVDVVRKAAYLSVIVENRGPSLRQRLGLPSHLEGIISSLFTAVGTKSGRREECCSCGPQKNKNVLFLTALVAS